MSYTMLLAFCSLLTLTHGAVLIPRPSGPYGVSIVAHQLTDASRLDPFAPQPTNRTIMVSTFSPITLRSQCRWKLLPYMPPATAAFADQNLADLGVPEGTFESFRLQSCIPKHRSSTSVDGCEEQNIRVVLFSPASTASRLYYSAMAQQVASFGFVVATIDHPYDAHIVEFPDGTVVRSKFQNPPDYLIKPLLEVRARDFSFVIDSIQLGGVLYEHLTQLHLPGKIVTDTVAMYAHSAGGGATILAMVNETRIVGGVNLDGGTTGYLNTVVKNGIDRPVLLFQADPQPEWPRLFDGLDGWRLWLKLKRSAHGTFTDVPLLAQLLGLDPRSVPGALELIGSIPGARAMEVITTYVISFVEFAFGSGESNVLNGANKAFPEVAYVRTDE